MFQLLAVALAVSALLSASAGAYWLAVICAAATVMWVVMARPRRRKQPAIPFAPQGRAAVPIIR